MITFARFKHRFRIKSVLHTNMKRLAFHKDSFSFYTFGFCKSFSMQINSAAPSIILFCFSNEKKSYFLYLCSSSWLDKFYNKIPTFIAFFSSLYILYDTDSTVFIYCFTDTVVTIIYILYYCYSFYNFFLNITTCRHN